jgi:hypothetical protein
MPRIPFDQLPDDARVWVFASSSPLAPQGTDMLLGAVDEYLEEWRAHGDPLRCARDWRDDRFLAIGVDQSTAGASGCSIDGLFRVLQRLQSSLGATLVGGGRVYYRDATGAVQSADRPGFARMAADSRVGGDTKVFDTTVTSAGAYRAKFELPLHESWHRDLTPARP